MVLEDLNSVLERLQTALEHGKIDDAMQVLESLRSPDQAEIFNELDDKDQLTLLHQLDPATSADILEELEDEEAAELARALPTGTAIRIIEEMEPDEAADLLGDIETDRAEAILAGLDYPEEVIPLLVHPDDSAGGLMTSDFLALRRRMTAGDAIQAIHDFEPEIETMHHLFVIDGQRHLCGTVSLWQLIVADNKAILESFMNVDVISVLVGTDQEACAQIMARYDLIFLPVVNEDNKLLGVISIDDVIDVLEEEATEDIQRFGGAQPLEKPYFATRILTVAQKRIGWLMLLFITESLTGTVLRHFEDELQTVVSLSFFVPLLIGTGGNAGSQTTSTIIRALAVGEIKLSDALLSLWHELRVGLMLGGGMAIVAYFRAVMWGSSSALAFTVAAAVLMIVIWANSLGAMLPLLAARLKIDPTIVSGPVMSTLVDATGLFIYFTIARIILGL